MAANGDWDSLLKMCRSEWARVDVIKRQEMSTMAAHAAWHMSEWRAMGRFVDTMDGSSLRETGSSESSLLRAVLAINRSTKNGEDFSACIDHIKRTRCERSAPALTKSHTHTRCVVVLAARV
jgi:FAT domain